MSAEPVRPDLSLFVDILKTLERIKAPYMIIGAFAGTIYGITRVTLVIDIVVDLSEIHVRALADVYQPPRYYADPEMMRNSIAMGILFNIIDTDRGEKADLIPLTMTPDYQMAFARRIRQNVEIPGLEPFEIWCARPEDIILGKLIAWKEGRSRKHQMDIYEMMTFLYLGSDASLSTEFDESYLDKKAASLGEETFKFWLAIKNTARKQPK